MADRRPASLPAPPPPGIPPEGRRAAGDRLVVRRSVSRWPYRTAALLPCHLTSVTETAWTDVHPPDARGACRAGGGAEGVMDLGSSSVPERLTPTPGALGGFGPQIASNARLTGVRRAQTGSPRSTWTRSPLRRRLTLPGWALDANSGGRPANRAYLRGTLCRAARSRPRLGAAARSATAWRGHSPRACPPSATDRTRRGTRRGATVVAR